MTDYFYLKEFTVLNSTFVEHSCQIWIEIARIKYLWLVFQSKGKNVLKHKSADTADCYK